MSISLTNEILGVPTTPQSLSDDFSVSSPGSSMSSRQTSPACYMTSPSSVPSPATSQEDTPIKTESDGKSEQKPVKKRKSWGQQLPTPTTNLPPRKRAKTAAEKEQRRVERVLRNRAAAQKSREVKKQQLEAIEKERDSLKATNEQLVTQNEHLSNLHLSLMERIRRLEAENRNLKHGSDLPLEMVPKEEPSSLIDYGLDPACFSAEPTFESSLFESPSMTHQPAALMCDLPCLQGTSQMFFTRVLTALMTALLSLSCFVWVTFRVSRIATRLSHLPQSLSTSPLPRIHSWTSLSTAIRWIPRRTTSQVCSTVLAHLRIATDCSSQQTSSSARVLSIVSMIRSGLVSGSEEVVRRPRRSLLETNVDRRSPHTAADGQLIGWRGSELGYRCTKALLSG